MNKKNFFYNLSTSPFMWTIIIILLIFIAIFHLWNYIDIVKFLEKTKKEPLVNMENVNANNNALQSKSNDYSNNLRNQITISIDDLALSTYNKNYLKIIDDMDNLFTMKMLENLLVIDYSDDDQMMKRVNRIGRISEAKKSLTEVKELVRNFAT